MRSDRSARPYLALLLFALPLSLFSVARRWDATGHKTVARIAWDHLTPNARAGAVRTLREGPPLADLESLAPDAGTPEEIDRGLFVESATWPDQVRTPGSAWHGYSHPNWHFDDNYWSKTGSKITLVDGKGPAAVNAIERVTALEAVLRDPSAADTTKAVALAWVIHLVGDIHQPLHMSSRVTAALPDGDRGGNSFKLKGKPNNLHSLWDDILDLTMPVGSDEDGVAYIGRLASGIQQHVSHASISAADLQEHYQDWGAESLQLAEHKAYPASLKPSQKPSLAYETATEKVAERRVALAGYRLAELLNSVFP